MILTEEQLSELRNLAKGQTRAASNDLVVKELAELGLAKQGLGGWMLTDKGKLELAKK